MFSLDKVIRILRALHLLQLLTKEGEAITGSDIARWASISKSTTYRYLWQMARADLIASEMRHNNRGKVFHWFILPIGLELFESQKELGL